MTELKPCPFCGNEVVIRLSGRGLSISHIEYDSNVCVIAGQPSYFKSEEEACRQWNTRTPINKDQAIKDSLEQRNDRVRAKSNDFDAGYYDRLCSKEDGA